MLLQLKLKLERQIVLVVVLLLLAFAASFLVPVQPKLLISWRAFGRALVALVLSCSLFLSLLVLMKRRNKGKGIKSEILATIAKASPLTAAGLVLSSTAEELLLRGFVFWPLSRYSLPLALVINLLISTALYVGRKEKAVMGAVSGAQGTVYALAIYFSASLFAASIAHALSDLLSWLLLRRSSKLIAK